MRRKSGFVYLLASSRNGTLYLGATSDLVKRIRQHKEGVFEGFSKRYGVDRLVWFEEHPRITDAIAREKQLKSWRRVWKLVPIEKSNPGGVDLHESLVHG
jgi:putative endonuclease